MCARALTVDMFEVKVLGKLEPQFMPRIAKASLILRIKKHLLTLLIDHLSLQTL